MSTFLDQTKWTLATAVVAVAIVAGWATQPARSTPDQASQMGLCGDADGSNSVTIADVISMKDYLFESEPPPDSIHLGDCDDYLIVNVRDLLFLTNYIFKAGPSPTCPAANAEIIPAVRSADTLWLPPDSLPAFDSTIQVHIFYKNSQEIHAIALPLRVSIGGSIPTVDTLMAAGNARIVFNIEGASIDSVAGEISIGGVATGAGLPAMLDTLLTLELSVSPESFARPVQFDTLRLSPDNSPLFLESNLDAYVPVILVGRAADSVSVPHDVEYILYSPVDMVVTDPAGDSIGIGFNTILNGATYDTTTDRNADLEPDDAVLIPHPIPGDYNTRIIREPGTPDTATFTLSIRINGNQQLVPEGYNNVAVAGLGTTIPENYETTVTPTVRGDADANGFTDAGDIVYLVNLVFKSGPDTVVPGHGDVNCTGAVDAADIIYMVGFVFKSGSAPCS